MYNMNIFSNIYVMHCETKKVFTILDQIKIGFQSFVLILSVQWDYSGKLDTCKQCKNYIEYICSVLDKVTCIETAQEKDLTLNLSKCIPKLIRSTLWQYGLWCFQTGDTKLEIFLPKNQHTQRKLLNFEFWINSELSKSTEI